MQNAKFLRFVMIMLLSHSSTCIVAQINIGDFLSPDKTWIEGYNWCGFEGDCSTWSLRYKFDTIPIELGGNTYIRLLKASAEFSEEWSDAEIMIRNEDGQVYIYDLLLSDSQLLYDFNLVKGDTFHLGNEQVIYDLVVDRVDTVSLLNGEQVKRWVLLPQNDASDPSEIVWLEGIGNLNGFMKNYLPWTSDAEWSTVLCVYWEDSLVYDNKDYETCWLMTTSVSEERIEQVSVVPNPASGHISLSGIENKPVQVMIFDAFGKRIYNGNEEYIAVDGLPSGYYFVVVVLKNRTIRRIPFVKI